MATTRDLLQQMRPGQALSKRATESLCVCRRSPGGTGYHVLAAWRVPEQHNEDPESVSCGCPLEGRSHCHAECDGLSLDAAVEAYTEAKAKFATRTLHQVTFARPTRIGA